MGASSDPTQDGSDEQQKRSEIYTYEAPWHVYAMNWSVRRDKKYRLAIASLLEQFPNRVEIVQLDDSNGEIRSDPNLSFEHLYPPTKTIFIAPPLRCRRPSVPSPSPSQQPVSFSHLIFYVVFGLCFREISYVHFFFFCWV